MTHNNMILNKKEITNVQEERQILFDAPIRIHFRLRRNCDFTIW